MRNILRIKPFLSRLDVEKLVKKIKASFNGYEDLSVKDSVSLVLNQINNPDFIKYWEDNPDLRFGQLLYNMGIEFMNSIYNYEESDILQLTGLSPTQSNFWISYLNKDEKLLSEARLRFIDELDTDHLEKMIEEHENGIRFYTENAIALFNMELVKRNNN